MVDFTVPLNGKAYDSKTKAAFTTLIRKRRYGAVRPQRFKNEWLEKLDGELQNFERFVGNASEAQEFILAAAGGTADRTVLRWILEASPSIDLRSDAYYRRFYWLFSLIVADKHFPTEEEFHRQARYYGRSFAAYQAKRVRNLIR